MVKGGADIGGEQLEVLEVGGEGKKRGEIGRAHV